MTTVVADPAAVLRAFEDRLDPSRPEAGDSGIEIIGYGEVSTVFAIPGVPDRVCKRMAGFADGGAAERYIAIVARYLEALGRHGVHAAETAAVHVRSTIGADVVYLLQPRLDLRGLGNHVLKVAPDAELFACLDRVLLHLGALMRANREPADGRTVTVDAQLANWHFTRDGGDSLRATMVDVGTPFMRLHGIDELGPELFLAPVPPGLRALYRRTRAVERYIDDYFDPRRLLLDLLGNFHKEGRPDRIDAALEHIHRWLAAAGADLAVRPIQREEVDEYYRKDAQLLELFLKARRVDRFVRTRILRQRYNFILPGAVRR